MNLSENLKKIRKDNNLSQEDLAEKLGVSRQSVSKWESGAAYPEMDKVLELCKLFNLNIDELLNQDIKEVEQNRQSKSTINKYIDSFLSYISKSVNLFISMKFKSKIKLIFEEFMIGLILTIMAILLGELLNAVYSNVFTYLPDIVFLPIRNILEGVYILVAAFAVIAIMIYIFKVRYLDYFEVVDKEKTVKEEDKKIEDVKVEKKIERKEEKVIIRDPDHSGYKFINGLVKVLLFFIRLNVAFIGIGFSFSLIGFVMCLVLSFLISESGLLFIGTLLGLLSAIVINIVILDIIISFIFNRKTKKGLLLIAFLTSLITAGVACGLVISSFKDFSVINEYDEKYYNTKEVTYKMNNNIKIDHGYDFVESNNKDIKIVYTYVNYCNLTSYIVEDDIISYYSDCLSSPELFKNFLSDLNDKKLVDDQIDIKIYTTKENINKITENNKKRFNSNHEDE